MPPSRTYTYILILLFALAIQTHPASAGNINTTIVTDTARTLPLTSVQGTGVSGGGGTGGGGIITDEPFTNILKYESSEKPLISGKSVRYSFTRYQDIPIYEIDLTGRENENYITVKVELLKGLSPKIKEMPDGIVYQYVNIYAGTRRIQEVKIRFRVSNEWLTDNNIADIKLNRWTGTGWEKLDTSRINEDNTNTFFESTTSSFSNFAIIGASSSSLSSPTGTETVKPESSSPVVAATPIKTEIPGFEGVMAIILLLLVSATRKKGCNALNIPFYC